MYKTNPAPKKAEKVWEEVEEEEEKKDRRMEKREEEEECDNKTFQKTKPAKKNEEDITICEISKNRRVVVRSWKGMVMVDIREFYMKDGDLLPGKKGISLPLDQWNILRDHVGEIDKALAENP